MFLLLTLNTFHAFFCFYVGFEQVNISWVIIKIEVVRKKGVLRNFTKFIGEHLCQSLIFNKVAGLRPKNTFLQRTILVTASVECESFNMFY